VEFVTSIVEMAGEIKHASETMGVSAEAAQRLKFAVEQNGGSFEALQRSAIFLNKTLGKNDAGTAAALEALGIDFDRLRAMNNEERFLTIANAIASLKDPILQDQLGVALLGRTFAENLPAMKAGLEQAGQGAAVMSDKTVESLHAAEQAWKRLTTAVYVYTGEAIGALIQGSDAVALREQVAAVAREESARKGILVSEELKIAWQHGAEGLQAYLTAVQNATRGAQEQAAVEQGPHLTALQVLDLTLARLNDKYNALLPAQRAKIVQSKEEGASTQEIATALDLEVSVVDRVIEAQKKSSAEAEKFSAASSKYEESFARMSALIDGTGMKTSDWAKQLIFAGASLEDVRAVTGLSAGAVRDLGEAVKGETDLEKAWAELNMKMHAAVLKDWDAFIKQQIALAEQRTKAIVDNVKAGAKADEDAAKQESKNAIAVADAQIQAAQRSDASLRTILQLRIERARLAFVEEIRLIQEKGQKEQDALTKGGADYKTAFDKIQHETDVAMAAAAQIFGVHVNEMVDDVDKKLKVKWSETFQGLGQMFTQLAQIGDGAFPAIARDVGEVFVAVGAVSKAMDALQKDDGFNAANLAQLAAGWVGVAVVIYQVASAIYEAHKHAEKAQAMINEGIMIATDLGRRAAEVFSENLTKAIDESANTMQAFLERLGAGADVANIVARSAAEALHLSEIIKEMGGISAQNVGMVESKMQELIRIIQRGGPQTAEATKALSDTLTQMGDYLEKHGGLWDDTFEQLIARANELGGVLRDQVNDILSQQAQKGAKGFEAFLTAGATAYDTLAQKQTELKDLQQQYADASADNAPKIKQQIDEVTKAIETQQAILRATSVQSQQAASAFGASLFGHFSQLEKSGMSVTQAIKEMSPAILAFQKQLDQTGLHGGAAFDKLSSLAQLAADNVGGPALDAISGLNDALVSTQNLGLMNQDVFAGLSSQVGQTYDALVAQGKDGNAALAAMQPTLQTIWELQDKFGYTTDAATQKLVDQAVQQNLVGKEHMTVSDQMLAATKRIADAAEAMAHIFGAVLPGDLDKFAKAGEDAAGRVKGGIDKIPKTVEVNFDWKNYTPPPGIETAGGYHPDLGSGANGTSDTSAANEGFFARPTRVMLGDAPGERGEYVLHASTVDRLMALSRAQAKPSMPAAIGSAAALSALNVSAPLPVWSPAKREIGVALPVTVQAGQETLLRQWVNTVVSIGGIP
jgi:hypothetical protein